MTRSAERQPVGLRSRAGVFVLAIASLPVVGGVSFAAAPHAAAPAPVSHAVSKLDDGRFIQGLRERGLSDVLIYFLQHHPPSDPVLKLEVFVEQYKLKADDVHADPKARQQAMLDVLDAYRGLIKSVDSGHVKQPIWRTDMAEYVLRVVLPARFLNAGDFVEFGVPTTTSRTDPKIPNSQRDAFDTLIAEQVANISDASDEMFVLIGALPRDPDFTAKYDNTGFYKRLNDEYNNLKLPFYRAWVGYYASLMSKPNNSLLGQSLTDLKGLVKNDALGKTGLAQVKSLEARVLIRQAELEIQPQHAAAPPAAAATGPKAAPGAKGKKGPAGARAKTKPAAAKPAAKPAPEPVVDESAQAKLHEAIKLLDEAIATPGVADMDALSAGLAKTRALVLLGEKDQAVAEIQRLRGEKFAASPMLQILIYDRWFHIAGDDYTVYDKLFEEPSLAQYKAQVRAFVTSRWKVNPNQNLESEPAPVVLSNIDQMLEGARKLMAQARGETDKTKREQMGTELKGLLDRAQTAATDLLKRKGLAPDQVAKAKFRLGMVELTSNKRYDAAKTWVELAGSATDQPESERAGVFGFIIAQAIYNENKTSKDAAKLFDASMKTLLQKYPAAKLPNGAPVSEVHYTYAGFLAEQNREDEAVAEYDLVGRSHPFYVDALYDKAVVLHNQWMAAPAKAKPALAQKALTAVNAASAAAQGAPEKAGKPARAKTLRHIQGDLILMNAELTSEGLNQPGLARAKLDGFDKQYGEFRDLVATQQRLMVGVLVRTGHVQEAAQAIKSVAQSTPSEAGPLAKGVLDSLNAQAEDLEKGGDPDGALKLRSVGVDLANVLLDWARSQPDIGSDPQKLLSFQTLVGEQMIAAHKFDEAEKLFGDLYKQPFGKKPDGSPRTGADFLSVVYGMAHLKFEEGKYDAAAPLINRVINAAPKKEGDTYWHSMLMMLQMQDHLREQGELHPDPKNPPGRTRSYIFRVIQQLKAFSPDMGGPRYKPQFLRLEVRNQPK